MRFFSPVLGSSEGRAERGREQDGGSMPSNAPRKGVSGIRWPWMGEGREGRRRRLPWASNGDDMTQRSDLACPGEGKERDGENGGRSDG